MLLATCAVEAADCPPLRAQKHAIVHHAPLHHHAAPLVQLPVYGPHYVHHQQAQIVYHIGASYRDDAHDEKVRQQARADYRQELEPLFQRIEQLDNRVANLLKFRGQGTFEISGDASGTTTGTATSATRPAAGGSAWDDATAKVMADNCLSCHAGSAPKGGLDLSDLPADRKARLALLDDIFLRMTSNVTGYRMPPDGERPSDADAGAIYKFKEQARSAK